MERFVIDGDVRLSGTLKVHGSKNAVLPMLAAAVLNKGISVIENVPLISDVLNMIEILKNIGCKCSFDDGILVIDSKDAAPVPIASGEAARIRTSVLFCGSFLSRFKCISVAQPGGCAIGSRPIDIHLDAFRKMGASVVEENGCLNISAEKINGIVYDMPFPSVGATQNIMMAAVGADGVTVIKNAAKEPEVKELGMFLRSMGAIIEGLGTGEITICGGAKLHDTAYVLTGDRIVAGTYMAACAAAGGKILLNGVTPEHCRGFLDVFGNMGCNVETGDDYILFEKNKNLTNPGMVETRPFPDFPTDMQSQLMSVMCVSCGEGYIVENIFENRFKNVYELKKMGADIEISENRALIRGKEMINGARLKACDLRGGAALIIAGLAACGRTIVEDEGFIGRGYEDIRRDLCLLGAHIE